MKRVDLILAISITTILIVSVALAQSGGRYDLTWNSIDGGATFSTSGPYSLGGTIGQPDAGVMSGGSYTLVGGFWGGVTAHYNIYLPLILRN